ncbi:hypothetical protein HZC00_05540 [Candidatus Kaiserbacteria bacterium]|nr:hypothetical protein [Candidatus Kaiserbacteria bacterium]
MRFIHTSAHKKVIRMNNENPWFSGKIAALCKGGSYGKISSKSIRREPGAIRRHGYDIPLEGLHIHVDNVSDSKLLVDPVPGAKKRLKSGPVAFFQIDDHPKGLQAVNVRGELPDEVVQKAASASVVETPAQPTKGPPAIIRDPDFVEESPRMETTFASAKAPPMDEAAKPNEPEEVLSVRSDKDQGASDPASSPETMREALKPVADGFVGLAKDFPLFLVSLVIDISRLAGKTGIKLLRQWQETRKSA